MRRTTLVLLILAGCTEPNLAEYEPRTGIITGTVLLQSPEPGPMPDECAPAPTAGNAIVTLFGEDAPPPPEGTSGPVNFVVVPERALFDAGRGSGGLFAAPFTVPTVPAGRYTLRGFLDADKDFLPTVDLLAQPTAGDIGGAYADPETREILPVEVMTDQETSQVTVTLALPIPAERPAFAITSTRSFAVPFAAPRSLVIEAHPINTTDIEMKPECTRFLVSFVDEDADGVPDDQNGDHLPDVYPRIVLRLTGQEPGAAPIVIPAIINPFPFMDVLAAAPFYPTDRLEVIIPPVAVEQGDDGNRILESIPAGEYETIVISGTGQTWQVPNDLAAIQPDDPPDPTQTQVITMSEGPALPPGSITGTVHTSVEAEGDVYVVAFSAADPPPPAGTGEPVALATLPAASFSVAPGGGRSSAFALRGLADGAYSLAAILDADGDLSPLVDLVAQPSAGDVGGRGEAPVTVAGGEVSGVTIEVDTPYAFDRPAFSMEALSVPRTGFPVELKTKSHAVEALGIDLESARVPVALAGTDLDGDNLPDLFPRVILSRLEDEGDPRLAANTGVLIPGIVDPLPFLSALGRGAPAVPSGELRIILPPAALVPGENGLEQVSPPPPGRYRVNVLSATGQTWSVPNDLDYVLGRVGGPLEDPTQTDVVVVEDTPVPGGAITGQIRLLAPEPAGEYQVVVLAFARNDPPPPAGSGRPRGIAVVDGADFSGGTAGYAIGGLATGVYRIRAFLDANDDFVPWFDAMNQPNAGDIGGGYLALPQGTLRDVNVDALGAPATGIEVSIVDQLTTPTDRPSFWIPTPLPVLDPSRGPINVGVETLDERTDVFSTQGVFPVQWIDLDGNGFGDDVNGDGNPDVYPIVVAELLDPDDIDNLIPSDEKIRIPGIIDPGQFAPLGFPAADPSQVGQVVMASTVTVIFPPQAVRAGQADPIIPPDGRYRITLVNGAGQTWTLPNELGRAEGTPYAGTQGAYLTVED